MHFVINCLKLPTTFRDAAMVLSLDRIDACLVEDLGPPAVVAAHEVVSRQARTSIASPRSSRW